MDGSILWSTELVFRVQQFAEWLREPMEVITFFGDEAWFLLFVSLIFWSINKRLGIDLGVLLIAAGAGNTLLKCIFKVPRPFWLDPALGADPIRSFSFPSGHAQTGTVLYGDLARHVSRGGIAGPSRLLSVIGLIVFILLVSLSRIILGVHFPGDVLVGILVGLVTLVVYLWAQRAVGGWLARRTLLQHVVLATLVGGLLLGLNLLALRLPVRDTGAYALFYAEGIRTSMNEAANLTGLVIGLWIGLALEARTVRFTVAGPAWQRTVRYLVGVLGILAIWMGLRLVFPSEPLALGLALRIVRYGLTMFWAIYLWPALFVRVGLGSRAIDSAPNA